MVEQTTLTGARRSIGNACLYRFLSKRAEQPFLRRNISHILDRHERELSKLMSLGSYYCAARSDSSSAEPPDRSPLEYWSDLPSVILQEVLEIPVEQTKPTFTIKPLTLCFAAIDTTSKDSDGLKVTASDPQWLSSRSKPYRCVVHASVYGFEESPIYERIDGHIYPTLAEHCCWITLNRSWTIKFDPSRFLERHGLPPDSDVEPDRLEKAMKNTQLKLEIAVERKDTEDDAKLSGKTLTTDWHNLFACPTTMDRLELYDGNVSLKPDSERSMSKSRYGLQINMGWNVIGKTWPLARVCKALAQSQEQEQHRLPTPKASQESAVTQRRYRITYIYQHSTRLQVGNLGCPLCDAKPEYSSFERLHMHLLVHHDHFEFHVDDTTGSAEGADRRTVRFSLREKPTEKANIYGKDEEKINWIAPARPFDQAALLRGQDTWTEQARPKAAGKRQLQPKQKEDATKAKRTVAPKPTVRTESPTNFKARPERKKKVHFVPSARHADGQEVRFYRTGSKRILKAGELVAESDDDINDSWLEQRERKALKRLTIKEGSRERQLSAAEQEFIVDFNRHVDEEERNGANGDVLRRSGIIRFAKQYRDKMRKPGWRRQFQGKLRRLVHYGVLDEACLTFCMSLAPAEQDPVVSDEDPIDLENTTNGRASGYARTRGVDQSDSHRRKRKLSAGDGPGLQEKGICFCGQRVESNRGSIFCANHLCIRERFHFACVDLNERPDGWLCKDCIQETSVS